MRGGGGWRGRAPLREALAPPLFVEADPPGHGSNDDPISLHKYLYANADPVNNTDPSGHDSLGELMVSAGIESMLNGLYISGPLRALGFARDLYNGVSLMEASENAAFGLLEDSLLNFGFGAAFSFLSYATPVVQGLRQAGQVFQRAAGSLWSLSPFARGFAIEAKLLEGVPNLIPAGMRNFPVIDYFYNGIARSIKSLDLTSASYQEGGAIISKLSGYAEKLSGFSSKLWRNVRIPPAGASINARELVVALEPGAATSAQMEALRDFQQMAATKWPNVKVLFEWVP